jgi:hypothetical protein
MTWKNILKVEENLVEIFQSQAFEHSRIDDWLPSNWFTGKNLTKESTDEDIMNAFKQGLIEDTRRHDVTEMTDNIGDIEIGTITWKEFFEGGGYLDIDEEGALDWVRSAYLGMESDLY